MSKLYIILGYKAGMSGGQIYVSNKANYLKNLGWKVSVIDNINTQPVFIKDLKMYENNIISELSFRPIRFSKKKRKRIILQILSLSGYNDDFEEVIIESNTITFSLWGELLAREINAKHVSILIDAFYTDEMRCGTMKYLDFKHKRRELAGINKNSLSELFEGYKTIKEDEKYYLSCACVNSVDKDTKYSKKIEKNKYDYVIGTVGRLNKPFVPGMVDAVVDFAKRHNDAKILFLVVGGQTSNDATIITDKTQRINIISNTIRIDSFNGCQYCLIRELLWKCSERS